MKSVDSIPFIDLIGDSDENFYQLGLKDAEAAKLSLRHTENLIKTPWNSLDSSLRFLAESMFKNSKAWKARFSPWTKAYAEGLGISHEKFLLVLLVPELTACFSKWMPRLPKALLGCSSLFYRNEDSDLVHLRTLDLPLGQNFAENERFLRTQFKNQPTIVSYGSAGFPYPSLTATTSEGITLALHQKFSDQFDANGTPIFELANEMLIRCGDLKTCLGFLRKSKSLTTWAFHLGFKDGQVLEADLSGSELQYQTYNIDDHESLYFNNRLIDEKKMAKDLAPLNFEFYNSSRSDSSKRKLKKVFSNEKTHTKELLKTWTTLENRKTYGLDVLTPSSLHVAALIPAKATIQAIVGNAPKTWKGFIQIESGLWGQEKYKSQVIGKEKEQSSIDKAWNHLMVAQSYHDNGDVHKLHHHLQLALRKIKGHSLENTVNLFHLIFSFLNETNPKALSQIASDAIELIPHLDKTVVDHAWLLVFRIEKILDLPISIYAAQINHPSLARLIDIESSIPTIVFKKVIRQMIFPRIELLDVFYLHQRIES